MSTEPGPREGSATVVVVAYNHAGYVEQALDSAFAQTHPDLRVVIFDDASPDDTADVIRAYLDRTGADATFVAHEVNRGLCATLNEALELVDTEYVAFISADDWMEPDRFAVQVAALEERGPAYGFVYSDMYRVTPAGDRLPTTYFEELIPSRPSLPAPPEGDIFDVLVAHHAFATPSLMVRTAVLRAAGPYDESLRFEDYDMVLRLARRSRAAYVPEPLVSYRDVPGSMFDQLYEDLPTLSREYRAIYRKHLHEDPGADPLLARQIGSYAKAAYLAGEAPARVAPDLTLAFRHARTPANLVYVVLATLRAPGRRVERAVDVARSAKARLRRRGRRGRVSV